MNASERFDNLSAELRPHVRPAFVATVPNATVFSALYEALKDAAPFVVELNPADASVAVAVLSSIPGSHYTVIDTNYRNPRSLVPMPSEMREGVRDRYAVHRDVVSHLIGVLFSLKAPDAYVLSVPTDEDPASLMRMSTEIAHRHPTSKLFVRGTSKKLLEYSKQLAQVSGRKVVNLIDGFQLA